jgi:hypothetical protein
MAMRILKIIGITLGALLILGLFAWSNWSLSQQMDKQAEALLEQTNERMRLERMQSTEERQIADLTGQLSSYAPHQQLLHTINARNEAADSLWDWLGRRVYLKSDSAGARKWAVTGVFFGGSRFDHRIWCEVTKDDIVRNVNPELIRP